MRSTLKCRYFMRANRRSLSRILSLILAITSFSAVNIAAPTIANAAAPTITSLSVGWSSTVGGVISIITGTNLSGVTSVRVGGVAATTSANSATRVDITIPANTAGAKDVVITTSGGTVTSVGAITYYEDLNSTVSCGTSGSFTIVKNYVTQHTSCTGTVTVPEGVIGINGSGGSPLGFYGAALSGTVSLPSTLRTIGGGAFYGTSAFSVVIPKGVRNMDGAFWTSGVSSLSFETPTSLTSLLASTIRTNGNLTSLVIPEGITTIGYIAVATNYALRTVTLPSTITTISADAFSNDNSLNCVVNPSNNSVVNNFAWPRNPINFPSGSNAFASRNIRIVTDVADCPAAPTITSLSTTSGTTLGGTKVVINGTNLTGTSAVKIGTFNAIVETVTATTVAITTPIGLGTSLPIHLIADGGWLTSASGITYTYVPIATKTAVTVAASMASPTGVAFGLQPKVTIQDALGNTVTGSSAVVTATVSAGGTLVGTTTATAVSGVATFSNLGLSGTGGTSYTITYTASGLTPATQSVRVARNCDGSTFTCEIGDIGPGGGTIFYVAPGSFTQTGATGLMCTTDCKYLEVAPAGWANNVAGSLDPRSAAYVWSTNTTTATGQDIATATTEGPNALEKSNWKIGQGYYNTSVMKVSGATSQVRDMVVGYQGIGNTAGQWFLPSVNELNEMCKWANNLTGGDLKVACVGSLNLTKGFGGYRYHASTEASVSDSWFINFGNNVVNFAGKNRGGASDNYFRPIRAFAGVSSYTVTLKAGTNGSGADQTLSKIKGTNLTLPDSSTANSYFTRAGYNVSGWSTTNGGSQTYAAGGLYITDSATTLYPVWTGNALTVSYNVKGGSSITTGSTVTGGSISAPAAPTKSGYTFIGWSETDGGTEIAFPFAHGKTSNFTIYALWSANSYVLTYEYNSATGDSATATSSFTSGGTPITLPTPTRTGYSFGGWYSDSLFATSIGSGGASYSPSGASLTPTAYAKWTGINRTVTYRADSATAGSVPVDGSNYLIGSTVAILGNTGSLARAGYSFVGWTYASDGTGTVLNSGSTYTTATSNMVFYAKWSANTYTVTYNKNGASGSPATASASYTSGGTAITLSTIGTMTKTGFNFGGWSESPTGSALAGTYTTTADITLYAVWTIKSINISFAKGDAALSTFTNFPAGRSSNYGTTITLSDAVDSTTAISGVTHAFMGWSDGSSTYPAGASYLIGESAPTFTAIWVKIFAVRYAFNGGTAAADSSDVDAECLGAGNTCSDGQVITANAAPTRTGYTFAGWVDQNNIAITAGGTFTVRDNKYLIYANWTPVDYSVSYNTAGGSTAVSPFTKQMGQTFAVASAPTKTGYTFTGWSDGISVLGAGATYYVGTSAVTLTAQWRANVYTVTYDWNGGVGSTTSSETFTVGGNALTLPLVGDHSKDGYSFGGWSASVNGSQVSDSYSPTADTTLYARWGTGSFTVTYNANGGTVSTASATILNGSSIILPTPSRESFVFEGWYSGERDGSLIGAAGDTYSPTQTRTVYAHWTQASLHGISPSALSRLGTITASSSTATSFAVTNDVSSVSVSVPAGSLPDGTTINIDNVSSFTRARSVLNESDTYIISVVVSWLTTSNTVPPTAAGKPITVTLTNDFIYTGASVFAIVAGSAREIGTATQDGTVTVTITSDPEVVVVSTKPNAPTNVTATSLGVAQSEVSWTAPRDGGAAISEYTVTSSGGQICKSATTSCLVTSLANGTAYTFSVTATNINGTSTAGTSSSVTTAGKPGSPTSVAASSGGFQSSTISWVAPVSNGGVTISQYVASADNGNICATSGTSCTITGLTDATTYTFTVTATNSLGTSDPSSSVSATTANEDGSSGSGGGSAPAPAPSYSTPSNVTVSAAVIVVGSKDADVITVEIAPVDKNSNAKPPVVTVDSDSQKFLADAKIVNGKLVLTAKTGFSGKKTVTVTIIENGSERIVQIPLTVSPESVLKPVLSPLSESKSVIRWTASPNATSYTVYVDGKRICSTTTTSCTISKLRGPGAVVEIVSNGGDRTVSEKIQADFKQSKPIVVSRVFSSGITTSTLSKTDTKAIDKAIALIRNQGFSTLVISNITTTKQTAKLATARITAIKSYILEKIGSKNLVIEVVPASSKTYFNNISVKA